MMRRRSLRGILSLPQRRESTKETLPKGNPSDWVSLRDPILTGTEGSAPLDSPKRAGGRSKDQSAAPGPERIRARCGILITIHI